MARVIQVIDTEERRGRGTEKSPIRMVRQFWSTDGELLVEWDQWAWDELRRCAESTRLDATDPSEDFRNEIVLLLRQMNLGRQP